MKAETVEVPGSQFLGRIPEKSQFRSLFGGSSLNNIALLSKKGMVLSLQQTTNVLNLEDL